MRPIIWLTPLLVIALGLASGCGGGSGGGSGSSSGGSSGGSGGPGNGNGSGPEPGSLAQLQEDIFGAICSQCHTGANAPQGLELSSEQVSFDNLVNQPSAERPELMRVAPGDPDNSYLVMKVEGSSDIVGGQMPLGLPPLTSEQIGNIRDWIANGAPREGVGEAPTTLSLAEQQKTAGGAVFTLRFSRPLDPETFDDRALRVYLHHNGERWLAWPDSYRVDLDSQTVTVSIPRPDVPASGAELVVDAAGLAAVFDTRGQQVAGEGDGTGVSGSSFTVSF